ncbi:MAG: DUF1579 domain-containing protein [Gloeobacteraceae cyanobacterium ES-bin-316]|nr:DUF1579 domain-containing protein [Ferruginibacter sp.]
MAKADEMVTTPVDSATKMKNWMAYMTPGDVHKMMASWNGTWQGDITMWEVAGAPPHMSKGTCTYKMLLGGRYQVGNFSGNMMGQPFEGVSTLAYDNAKKVFISSWVDNMGTGIMTLEGTWDEASKTINFAGKGVDPTDGTGKDMAIRETFKVIDDKNQFMEMYGPGPDGKEFKMMEIKYTRK